MLAPNAGGGFALFIPPKTELLAGDGFALFIPPNVWVCALENAPPPNVGLTIEAPKDGGSAGFDGVFEPNENDGWTV